MRYERVEYRIDRPERESVDIDGTPAVFHKVPLRKPMTDRFFFKDRKVPFRVDMYFFKCPDCGDVVVDLKFWEEFLPVIGKRVPLAFSISVTCSHP